MTDHINKASSEAELAETEQSIDDIIKGELEKHVIGNADAKETAALGLATHRLEHLIAQRKAILDGKRASALHA